MGFWKSALRQSFKAKIREDQRKKAVEAKQRDKLIEQGVKRTNQLKEQAEKYFDTIRESAELVNTTTKPEVFFPRFALILECFEKLAEMEASRIYDTSKYKPQENYQNISNTFTAATNDFINRSFEELQSKVALVEAEQAKAELIKRYFKGMDKYLDKMEAESINLYYSLKEQYSKK